MVYKFFDKKLQGKGLANNKENIQLEMNFRNQLLKNLIKEMCILHLKTIFGV